MRELEQKQKIASDEATRAKEAEKERLRLLQE